MGITLALLLATGTASEDLLVVLPLDAGHSLLRLAERAALERSLEESAEKAVSARGIGVRSADSMRRAQRRRRRHDPEPCDEACVTEHERILSARYRLAGMVTTRHGVHVATIRVMDEERPALDVSLQLKGKTPEALQKAWASQSPALFARAGLAPAVRSRPAPRPPLEPDLPPGPLRVSFAPGKPSVSGSLGANEVTTLLRSKWPDLRECYERALEYDRRLAGMVGIYFEIGAEGEVLASEVRERTIDSAFLIRCILTRVDGWTFPPPPGGGNVRVAVPLRMRTR